jgi:lon-related putative ATP-dependent protease
MTNRPMPRELAPGALRRACDPSQFSFETTAELTEPAAVLGQARAVEAIRFGIGIAREGYNLYAMGPEGIGRRTIVQAFLERDAPRREVPPDWCYVFNFEVAHRPCAIPLPPGRVQKFQADMAHLVDDLRTAIPAVFESDEYRNRRQEIESQLGEQQESAIGTVGEHAKAQGIALLRTPGGFGFAPIKGDGVMGPKEFAKLPEAEQQRLESAIAELQKELEHAIHEMPKWRRTAQRRLRELNREVIRTVVASLIDELKSAYADIERVAQYLAAVQNDVLDHAEAFQQSKDGETPTLFGIPLQATDSGETTLRRYQVNVLIAHAPAEDGGGAPIVYEDNPTHANLIGRIEHIAQMGTLVTDFTLIKAGALHRANGGYLILDALKVLTQPFAWEALKRALRSREIRTESLGQALSLISTVSLEPEPIPLDVKIVLVGERRLYYLLHEYDPEFSELFKVAVDFEDDVVRNAQTDAHYAHVIADIARREQLRPLDRAAVARAIERGARVASDAERLSLNMRGLADLLRESDYWASVAGRAVIQTEDVQHAIDRGEQRRDRIRERLREEVLRGTLLIDSAGTRVGQVNGLAVAELGGFAFGMPRRITARARFGAGRVLDIERESELGGPIHSKGVLILSGFLAGRYVPNEPLSLAASLVFEQSYGGIEGDSASSAELYALLSALADVPIRQSVAVTGSVNQQGDVQAIGGVNEKIEGFFDLCQARGLTGEQGVLVPASNVQHLMLRADVIEAVAAGRFHVYPVATIDQGIERLTGIAAGERGPGGAYPPGSINARVERRLAEFAERSKAAGADRQSRKSWRGTPSQKR